MDGIFAWLNDKKNFPIIIAGAAILVVLFFVIMKMTGRIGGQKASTQKTGTNTATTMSATGTGTQGTMPGGMMMPPGMPGMSGGMSMMGGNQASAAPTPSGIKLPPMLPYRKDPFISMNGIPSKKDILATKLASIGHDRLAPLPIDIQRSETQEALPPQPTRRLAGILWNGKVSAILETNGEMDVIRPGMVLDRGNSKVMVESIQANSVILKTLDTRKPMTIKVTLAGSPNAAMNNITPATGMPSGMPGMPGGMMMPGMPGGLMMPGGMPGMPGMPSNLQRGGR